jgi:hypothetical protein
MAAIRFETSSFRGLERESNFLQPDEKGCSTYTEMVRGPNQGICQLETNLALKKSLFMYHFPIEKLKRPIVNTDAMQPQASTSRSTLNPTGSRTGYFCRIKSYKFGTSGAVTVTTRAKSASGADAAGTLLLSARA